MLCVISTRPKPDDGNAEVDLPSQKDPKPHGRILKYISRTIMDEAVLVIFWFAPAEADEIGGVTANYSQTTRG